MSAARLETDPQGPTPDETALGADLRQAYKRGRQDERASRKRHPVGMTFLFVAALVGVILLALAAVNGSFSGGGGVVDQNLSKAVGHTG